MNAPYIWHLIFFRFMELLVGTSSIDLINIIISIENPMFSPLCPGAPYNQKLWWQERILSVSLL